jgi:predicted nucleic acid-binding protein
VILVDSSVWVDHWDKSILELSKALLDEQVLVHPWVIGELSLTDFQRRKVLLSHLSLQSEALVIDDKPLLKFIQEHRLHESGLGWVDCQLLASAKAMTHDKAMKRAWEKVKRA